MKGIRHLLTYLKPYIWITLLAPLLMVVEVAMDLLQPTIMQYIIDEGIAKGQLSTVISYSLVMIGCAFVGLFGGLGCIYFSSRVGINLATDLRADLYEVMSYFSTRRKDEVGTGKLVTIMTSDVEMVQRALMMTLRIFVRGPLMFIGAVIIVWFTARELFSILLIIVPLLIILIFLFTQVSAKIFARVQKATDDVNTRLSENLAGIQVVKAYHRMKEQILKFTVVNRYLTRQNQSANQVIGFLSPLSMFIINIGIAAALWFGAIQVEMGGIQVGVILAFINYLNLIMGGIMSSMMVLMQMARAIPSVGRIHNILVTTSDLDESTVENEVIHGEIEFKNVSFAYNENGENVLKNIDLHVRAGETLGIIGMTGTGKSTLLKLIPRLYDVRAGEILLDGKPIKTFDVNKLRQQIGLAPQQAKLFTGSIAENIRYGDQQADEQQLELALEQANAWEFVEKYPNTIEHHLSQGAGNLSGGQRQRLAMARAFIRKAKILILDDTTSAVDTISEKRIQQHIREDFTNQTVILVSSKISTIQHANQIIVVNDGRITARGTHDELLKISKEYQETFQLQQQQGGVLDGQ
ncbi:MAG: ABC transporter ATP-binding protein [Kurthia sp.]|nr:ABC transporter ATP-binding protein [Candidatus Kurthia equi]